MAEYSQTGLLAALLLFTALTVRDVYVGRTTPQRPGPTPTPGSGAYPDISIRRLTVFQEYSRAISQLYPDIRIEGENHPPTPFNRYLGNFISYLKLLAIVLIVSGQNPFNMMGVATPYAWIWSQDNKIFSCLMAFFLCNMMETHFLSTGAFEVTLNDVPIWSKLQSGYVPNIQELFQILDNHLKMNQVDPMSFSST
uniref:Selenoprotein T n=1 Tax=Sphaeramia orbicularis TaxID=375764 RepID=A0A672ZQN5_9TELE